MHEEAQNGGVLTGAGAAETAPGLDPLKAVAAVAGPRGEEERRLGETEPRADVLVETRVKLEGGTEPPGDAPAAGDDGYGEFAWPDGYQADPAAMARFVPLARKLGLSRDSAQSLAGLYAELDMARNQAQAEFVAKNNAEWLREIQSHPEFGGSRLRETGEEVATVMRRFGSPLLTAQIRQMNVQNWPEMFYFLARVARAVGEDSSPSSGPGSVPPKSTAQLLFPGLK